MIRFPSISLVRWTKIKMFLFFYDIESQLEFGYFRKIFFTSGLIIFSTVSATLVLLILYRYILKTWDNVSETNPAVYFTTSFLFKSYFVYVDSSTPTVFITCFLLLLLPLLFDYEIEHANIYYEWSRIILKRGVGW